MEGELEFVDGRSSAGMTDIPILNNDFDLPNDEHLFGLGSTDQYKGNS